MYLSTVFAMLFGSMAVLARLYRLMLHIPCTSQGLPAHTFAERVARAVYEQRRGLDAVKVLSSADVLT